MNFAVRHVRQNAFIANGAATTTMATTTTVTAIVTVVTVIIDVARTELLDRLPPLSRGEPCVRRIRVCPMVVGGYLRWSYRAGLSPSRNQSHGFSTVHGNPKIRKCKYERNRRKTNIARHRWR